MPIFNEARYLRTVLARVRQYSEEILVVDDGSTDATPELLAAETGIHRIRHAENRGYGQSMIDAFEFARQGGYEWLVTMDCDEQHEPSHIPEFLAVAARGEADIISGSRYLSDFNGDSVPPLDRREINMRITWMLNNVLGMRITDGFCGFKAYRVESLRELRLTETGYAFPLQFWVQVVRAGLRITELPVRLIYKDPNRHFGGVLDDPEARLAHYLDVFCAELLSDGRYGSSSTPTPCASRP